MIYKYRCEDQECDVLSEKAIPMKDFDSTVDSKCPKCGGVAKYEFQGAPAVATSGMSQAPLDVVIGRDAAKRWENIHQRQDKRDKVRRDAGKTGLTQTGYNEFQPISDEKKAKRTEGMRAVEKEGFKPLND